MAVILNMVVRALLRSRDWEQGLKAMRDIIADVQGTTLPSGWSSWGKGYMSEVDLEAWRPSQEVYC